MTEMPKTATDVEIGFFGGTVGISPDLGMIGALDCGSEVPEPSAIVNNWVVV